MEMRGAARTPLSSGRSHNFDFEQRGKKHYAVIHGGFPLIHLAASALGNQSHCWCEQCVRSQPADRPRCPLGYLRHVSLLNPESILLRLSEQKVLGLGDRVIILLKIAQRLNAVARVSNLLYRRLPVGSVVE